MRDIKFRMWEKKSKKMYDVERINFKDHLLNMWNSKFYSSSLLGFEAVEIMQYTGLKDKKGKEIYEGDIVKTHFIGGDGVENDEIIFDRGCFCVNYSEDYHPLLNELNHCSEVIGNIYENPELLEEGEIKWEK